jgi:hypothetical protein
MPLRWTSLLNRFINRFIPMRLLPRRYNTEMVLRGLYQKYTGQNLTMALQRSGMTDEDIEALFDFVDHRYGAEIFSRDDGKMERALGEAARYIAGELRAAGPRMAPD